MPIHRMRVGPDMADDESLNVQPARNRNVAAHDGRRQSQEHDPAQDQGRNGLDGHRATPIPRPFNINHQPPLLLTDATIKT